MCITRRLISFFMFPNHNECPSLAIFSQVISHNSNSNAALHSVLFESILRESNSENMNSAHPQVRKEWLGDRITALQEIVSPFDEFNSSFLNYRVWRKVGCVTEMLERRKRDAEEADLEQIDSMDLELPQLQLQSQEERPAEVHQQHFRFPAIMQTAFSIHSNQTNRKSVRHE